jgi:hypothetical protein
MATADIVRGRQQPTARLSGAWENYQPLAPAR